MTSILEGALPTSVENAAGELIKTGVLGAILVIIFSYAFWVTREWNKTQEGRVNDQKAVTDTLVNFSTSMKDVMRDLKGAIDALKATTDEERKALALIDTALLEIDRTGDINAKGISDLTKTSADLVKATADLKSQGDEARRAHDSLAKSVDVHVEEARRSSESIFRTVDDLSRRKNG